MTAPVPHGYPDWQRVAAVSDTELLNTGTVPTGTGVTYTIGYVGNYDALWFFARSNVVGHRFNVQFFTDDTYTSGFSAYNFDLIAGTRTDRVLAVIGAFMRISVSRSAVNGTHEISLFSTRRGAILMNASANDNTIISRTAINVGAGLTDTSTASKVWPGETHFNVSSAAATWTLEVQTLDMFSNVGRLAFIRGTAGETVPFSIFAPCQVIRTIFTNTSGAADVYHVYAQGRNMETGA